jgi:RNA polymerase sigma factor (sigma-70 family)
LKKADVIQKNRRIPADPSGGARDRLIERLFNEHNESLIRFLRVRLRSDEEAKEVAQEAYVRLLQLENPQAVSYFRAFLFKTATNIAIDRLRRDTLDQKHVTLSFFGQAVPSAEHTELHRDLLRKVGDCLQELPPKCRKAFLLNRIYGVSTADIAAQMRLTQRMIRMYLVRATLHCQCRLGDGEHDED